VTGGLQQAGDGGGEARCIRCGAMAVGPCARCKQPVCGDCCVLTEGGAKTWAICLACEDRGGRSLRSPWVGFLLWLAVPILGLAAVVILLSLLAGR
jgi:hypothetical protein